MQLLMALRPKHIKHKFESTKLIDYVNDNLDTYSLCRWCGEMEGTNQECLTTKEYEQISKRLATA